MFSAWKLITTFLMVGVLVAGLTARPPRQPVASSELSRLVLAVVILYAVGALALLTHRTALAAAVVALGLGVCALALWLSRGSSRPPRDGADDGGHGGPRLPPQPQPPGPDFDWSFYEDQFSERVA